MDRPENSSPGDKASSHISEMNPWLYKGLSVKEKLILSGTGRELFCYDPRAGAGAASPRSGWGISPNPGSGSQPTPVQSCREHLVLFRSRVCSTVCSSFCL